MAKEEVCPVKKSTSSGDLVSICFSDVEEEEEDEDEDDDDGEEEEEEEGALDASQVSNLDSNIVFLSIIKSPGDALLKES